MIDPKVHKILALASSVTGKSKSDIINEALREQMTSVIEELLGRQDGLRAELEKNLGDMRSEKRTRGGQKNK